MSSRIRAFERTALRILFGAAAIALSIGAPAQTPFASPVVPVAVGAPLDAGLRAQQMQQAMPSVPGAAAIAPDLMRPVTPVIRNGAGQPGALDANGVPRPQASEQGRIAVRSQDVRTEFQDFIEKSTGKTLPIFGASLFIDGPTTFAPAYDVPVTPDYVIGPGDEIVIRAWGSIDVDYRAVVERSGSISIPRVGTFQLAGIRYAELNKVIHQQVSRVYRNFELSTTLGQTRAIRIYVVGNAFRPGAYTVTAMSTLVNAVLAAGGPSTAGSLRKIELRRSGRVVTRFDFYDLLLRGDKSQDVRLQSEDVIWIAPLGQQVAITGSVNSPAIFELNNGNTIADLVEWAGGLTNTALGERITLERIKDRNQRVVEDLDATRASLSMPLVDGDLVTVYSIQRRFENAVTVRGAVARPMRMSWRNGMRVSDLIPNRAALITDQYYLGREQAILPSVVANEGDGTAFVRNEAGRFQRVPLKPGARAPQAAGEDALGGERNEVRGARFRAEVDRTIREPNWEYAVVERLRAADLSPELIPFNLGRAVNDRDPQHNLELRPGDVVTIFSREDIAVPRERQTKFVRLEGEFVTPGIYRTLPGETLRQLVARVGGITANAFLFGSEFTRESVRAEQEEKYQEVLRRMEQEFARTAANQTAASGEDAAIFKQQQEARMRLLDRLRRVRPTGRVVLNLGSPEAQPKDLPDLALQDGDRFVVPARPEAISVYGSVFNEGSFLFTENRRVGDYVALAGGATRTADRSSTFVIRADGSVASARQASWFGGLDGRAAWPGDTVFVPEDFERQPVIKTVRDWTQILYQFGLGAAAVKVLKN